MAYNFNSPSPYAVPRKPPRWPWAFGIILLLAVIATTALLLNGGIRPGDSNEQLIAQSTEQSIADSSTETPEPTATFTPVPTPTPLDLGQPTEVAQDYIDAWNSGDYATMYSMLSTPNQQAMTEEEFEARYTDIMATSGVTETKASLEGDVNEQGEAPFSVTYSSALVGDIAEENEITLAREGDQWRVNWTPSMIYKDLGTTGCVAFDATSLTRGRILDRNGKVLAEDAPVTRVSVVPESVSDPDTTYPALADILQMPVDDIYARVNAASNPAWPVMLKDMPADQQIDLINRLQPYDGVQIRPASQRHYPYGAVTAHVVGWVSIATQEDIERDESGNVVADQLIGRTGLEYGANDLLAGTPGGRLIVVECTTRAERMAIAESPGEPPKDIYTTIDVDFQIEVDKALTAQEKPNDETPDPNDKLGQRSAAVVIDPRTGAVLAMVSHPSFDPNGFITGNFAESDIAVMQDPVLTAELNRATMQGLSTGSIFKVITTAGAMDTLDWTGDTPVDCPANFTIGDQQWDDWTVENGLTAQGMLTLHQGLVNSCNTVFYEIGAQMDAVDEYALPNMARSFGLGERTGIPYFPEVAGTIPDPEWKLENINDGWARGDAVNLSIGQGYSTATPLQMARAYAAIANGGDVLRPFIVDKTQVEGEDPVQVGERQVVGQIPLDDTQMTELQAMLRDQTSDASGYGSTRVFGDFPWSISGKTGTAQDEADAAGRPQSWFAAYGPYPAEDEATVASTVVVQNVGEGISWAAPATKLIYEAYLKTNLGDADPVPEASPPAD